MTEQVKEEAKEIKSRNTDKKRIEALEAQVLELSHDMKVFIKALRISPDLFKR